MYQTNSQEDNYAKPAARCESVFHAKDPVNWCHTGPVFEQCADLILVRVIKMHCRGPDNLNEMNQTRGCDCACNRLKATCCLLLCSA